MKKVLVLFLAFFCVMNSCKKEDPPALPPVESMVMDFKAFGGGEQKSEMLKSMLAGDTVPGSNFTYSVLNVGFWNIIIFVNLWVPVSSWYAAIGNNDWKMIDKNTWEWKFTFNALFGTYNSRLVANDENADTRWEMYISKTGFGAFPEVKWYEGTMAKDGNSGHWTINENPTNPNPYLQIDWEKTGSEVGYIKYTCVKEKDNLGNDNVYYNNYIEYGQTTDFFNRYYNIVLNDNATTISVDTVRIEWNNADTSGHVKSQQYFGDANWHCWDTAFQNITCQ